MVPMLGAIIPLPLQMPATVKVRFLTSACFSTRSVVMMALAAAVSPSPLRARRGAIIRTGADQGKVQVPAMTPVEPPQPVPDRSQAFGPILHIACASARPLAPV